MKLLANSKMSAYCIQKDIDFKYLQCKTTLHENYMELFPLMLYNNILSHIS